MRGGGSAPQSWCNTDREGLMENILGILLLVGIVVLYYVVLPRLGVPT
ncbi:MAG: hypothetical protein NVS2B16_35830 [Chloroflexota bacterium]